MSDDMNCDFNGDDIVQMMMLNDLKKRDVKSYNLIRPFLKRGIKLMDAVAIVTEIVMIISNEEKGEIKWQ